MRCQPPSTADLSLQDRYPGSFWLATGGRILRSVNRLRCLHWTAKTARSSTASPIVHILRPLTCGNTAHRPRAIRTYRSHVGAVYVIQVTPAAVRVSRSTPPVGVRKVSALSLEHALYSMPPRASRHRILRRPDPSVRSSEPLQRLRASPAKESRSRAGSSKAMDKRPRELRQEVELEYHAPVGNQYCLNRDRRGIRAGPGRNRLPLLHPACYSCRSLLPSGQGRAACCGESGPGVLGVQS